ncbi:hypothetical protein TSUD_130890 [Trifolium subterraneum]|nr:hypothetical protein TSUD_130890 [Trifolium subterraneum]
MEDPSHPQIADDPELDAPSPPNTIVLRAGKRKKFLKQTATQKKKFDHGEYSGFDRNQSILKRLGLWNFVRIEFESVLCIYLIAQLTS